MSARTIVALAASAVVALAATILATGDSDPYRISIPLRSGYGLEDGSPVRVGGIERGTVELRLDSRDRVIADLELDRDVAPVGKDARIAIVAANFLGQKRVDLDPGNPARAAAPSGTLLDGGAVAVPTDLDQVLGVFDADTQVRARMLINALGEAVVGRKADVRALLAELPAGLEDAAAVVQQLTTDNRTMRALIRRSDNFLGEAARERRDLGRLIDVLADSSSTIAARRTALRAALARAPSTLSRLTTVSRELEATAADLGPAARDITAVAPALDATLARVESVRKAAEPALRSATSLAPRLTELATDATPVVRKAVPAAASVADLARALPPISATLDNSSANLLAIIDNWSKAIQFRDGMGHVFRGEASVTPDVLLSAVNRLVGPAPARRDRRHGRARRPGPVPTRTPPPVDRPAPERRPLLPRLPGIDSALDDVDKLVDGLTDALKGGAETPRGPAGRDGMTELLDYLLAP